MLSSRCVDVSQRWYGPNLLPQGLEPTRLHAYTQPPEPSVYLAFIPRYAACRPMTPGGMLPCSSQSTRAACARCRAKYKLLRARSPSTPPPPHLLPSSSSWSFGAKAWLSILDPAARAVLRGPWQLYAGPICSCCPSLARPCLALTIGLGSFPIHSPAYCTLHQDHQHYPLTTEAAPSNATCRLTNSAPAIETSILLLMLSVICHLAVPVVWWSWSTREEDDRTPGAATIPR